MIRARAIPRSGSAIPCPYSGPASSYGVIGKTQAAYFNKINAEGGINGRKITFITYDDAYSPPKADRGKARKLVESDEVLLLVPAARHAVQFGHSEIHGMPKKVPQLFVAFRRHQVG